MAEWDLGADGWRLIEFVLRIRREALRSAGLSDDIGLI